MMASVNFIVFVVLILTLPIHGQDDDIDLEPTTTTTEIIQPVSTEIMPTEEISIEDEFPSGLCPEGFHQLGDECLYFLIEGNCFSWKNSYCVCSQRIERVLKHLSLDPDQTVVQPAKGGRPLTLNTPEKTKLLRAMVRDYDRSNYAVQLPHDYDKLERCNDGTDDFWPEYCDEGPHSESACFETAPKGENNICLQEVPCNETFLRVACEFTLPERPELKESKFRNCPTDSSPRSLILQKSAVDNRIPKWVWIVIGVLAGLLLLAIIIAIVALVLLMKKGSTAGGVPAKGAAKPSATTIGAVTDPLLGKP